MATDTKEDHRRERTASSGSGAKKAAAAAEKDHQGKRSGGNGRAAPTPKPFRREIGAAVCLLLAFFAAIGYFRLDGVVINWFCILLKGLFGYGFWLATPALLLAAWILAFHRGRPVALRMSSPCFSLCSGGAAPHPLARGHGRLETNSPAAVGERSDPPERRGTQRRPGHRLLRQPSVPSARG